MFLQEEQKALEIVLERIEVLKEILTERTEQIDLTDHLLVLVETLTDLRVLVAQEAQVIEVLQEAREAHLEAPDLLEAQAGLQADLLQEEVVDNTLLS